MTKFEDGDQFLSAAKTVAAEDFQSSIIGARAPGDGDGYLRWGVASSLAAQTDALASAEARIIGEENWSMVAPLRLGDTVQVTTTVLTVDVQREQPLLICRRDVRNQAGILAMIGGASLAIGPALPDREPANGDA